MILIPLNGKVAAGRSAIIDDDFADELSKCRWHCHSDGYACRSVQYKMPNGKRSAHLVFMHREVLRLAGIEIPDGYETDHINHDKLDNRLSNLRVVTTAQNQHNQKPQGGSSRYKGVSWEKCRHKWRASIRCNGTPIHIGVFTNEIEAAKAYEEAARLLYGEYAYTQGDC